MYVAIHRPCVYTRVYNKGGGRVSYSSIVPCTAVVRVQARLMIFTTCCTLTVDTTCSLASALRDYAYTASHNDTIDYSTHCEYH